MAAQGVNTASLGNADQRSGFSGQKTPNVQHRPSNVQCSRRVFSVRCLKYYSTTPPRYYAGLRDQHNPARTARGFSAGQVNRVFGKIVTPVKNRIRRMSAALLVLGCVVALTSASNLPNRSPDLSPRLASLRTAAKSAQERRMLTLADRIAYQRAIEEVYWRHRIWPKERPDPKPSLDQVMPSAQLEKKVEDYLRNSQALDDYWKEPLSAEQLQAEMERMAQHTKQPEVLRELFAALGNDPFVIAECLARPALSERLVTNFYAHDQRFHGDLKRRAEAGLRTHRSLKEMKQLSGKYSVIEFVKSDSAQDDESRVAEPGLKLNSREWDENVQKLVAIFGSAKNGSARSSAAPITQIKTGVLSPLQEDEGRYYAAAVLKKSKDRLKLATVEWRKESLESWRARAESQALKAMAVPATGYRLPKIAAGGCIDDTWAATAKEPDARAEFAAVWTGSEMIVWGGSTNGAAFAVNTGERYNPGTDTWTPTSTTNAPEARKAPAVWTGSEMIVWGGSTNGSNQVNTGGRYNPGTDSWIATSMTNAPTGRVGHTVVWTGSEMIVWGGINNVGFLNTGGRYNPGTNSWTATSTTNAPAARHSHSVVWTGSEMIVWGGLGNGSLLNTGGRYNPTTDSWTATSTVNAPDARDGHAAVWTGSEMIVWGGIASGPTWVNTGGRYNPGTDSWTATSTTNAPTGRYAPAVWTGSEMIVWGGTIHGPIQVNTGGKYDPGTDSWTATSTTNAPTARDSHTAVWTGSEMIVWGGSYTPNNYPPNAHKWATGGRYNPSTDSWTATGGAPEFRDSHTAVWTGSEMIVWGGIGSGYFFYLESGGKYNPGTDTWAATSIANVPTPRSGHTAVWTGSEMIVWGGSGDAGDLNTGGRYNPGTDSWTATSTANAPTSRSDHTAVWTGNEMIVWGGQDQNFVFLNTGGRYNPGTDYWTATSTTNAPTARSGHTAVWTGSEMIVWGAGTAGGRYNLGTDSWTATSTTNAPTARSGHTAVWTGSEMIVWGGTGDVNTGGRYNPGTDSWTATSTTNAPEGRHAHTAVWTGSEMIVWGGQDQNFVFLNTGGRYNPGTDYWTATSTTTAPSARVYHTAVWTGGEMIVWGGSSTNTGGRYCSQSPAARSQLGNISARSFVQTGDNVMIGGFIITGSELLLKRVIVRAIGPSLVNHGIPNPLQDPTLELHDHTGAVIAFNDNWMDAPNRQEIIDSGLAPSNNLESAILMNLNPGNYTAIVRGVNNGTGIGLVEVYDLDLSTGSKLGNLSTRALVQTGDNVLIGGLIITGSGQERVILRAIGPSLARFGIPNPLLDPTLELHDGNGTVIAFNDNWRDSQQAEIEATGLAPTDDRESAIVRTLAPGNYTAIVRGVNGTIGVALVEVYDLQ
jgi:N-acetylneuraminic acid mutarotase